MTTTLKAIVRKPRVDGLYSVYIRIVHRFRMGYIKTSKIVTDKQLNKAGEIKDAVLNDFCAHEILHYSDIINRKDVSQYSVGELIKYLTNMDEDTSFSEFADAFIVRMRAEGHEWNAKKTTGWQWVQTKISENIAIVEMPLSGQTIFEYGPKSHSAAYYWALSEEIIVRERNR